MSGSIVPSMCRCSSAHGGESETTSFAIHPACQKGANSAKWRAHSGIVDGEAHQGSPAHHILQDLEARIGHVRVLPAGQVPQSGEAGVLEYPVDEEGVPADRKTRVAGRGPPGEQRGEYPHRVVGGRAHEPLGLVLSAAGEPLLGPAARGRAGLDVAGATLVRAQLPAPMLAKARPPDRVPAPAQEDDGDFARNDGELGAGIVVAGNFLDGEPAREAGNGAVAGGEEDGAVLQVRGDRGVFGVEPAPPARQPLGRELEVAPSHQPLPGRAIPAAARVRALAWTDQRGTHAPSAATEPTLTTPMAIIPAASDPSAAPPATMSGPPEFPASANNLQMPRNWLRPPSGAASAARVMRMPEPIPLPKPRTSATAVTAANEVVKGRASIAAPMMSIEGIATHSRPKASMTLPAG